MSENKFVGLDLSLTSTGCYAKIGGLNDTLKTSLIVSKPDQFQHSIFRCEYIADKILEFLGEIKPDMVAIEDYFAGRQPYTVIQLAELGTMVRYKMIKSDFHFYTIAPMQLKKYATSKGNCEKDNVMKGIYKKWNVDVSNNNIADACVLSYIAESIYCVNNNLKCQLLEYEREVIDKVLKERKMF